MRKAASLSLCALLLVGCSDEASSKHEWSILQVLEYKFRGQSDEKILVERVDAYCAVGFLSKDGTGRVWVLMNAMDEPLFKALPDEKLLVPKAVLDALPPDCRGTTAVRNAIMLLE
jgi:hypothetical protein